MPLDSFYRRSLRSAWVCVLGLLLQPAACADLMLFPTRVVFDRNDRAAQVELVNQGKTPETYRIVLVNRRMSEDGVFQEMPGAMAGEQSALEMLRYSPKQVTIEPGGSQTVRILLRKPAELAPGEYRSHLQFDRVADDEADGGLDARGGRPGGSVGVTISTLVGASIPVIVRHGETQADTRLSALRLLPAAAQEPPVMLFEVHRTGNRSTYGDFTVTYVPSQGTPVELSMVGGLAVYVPNVMRRVRMPLRLAPGLVLKGGSLRVAYRERPESGGKLLAEAALAVP